MAKRSGDPSGSFIRSVSNEEPTKKAKGEETSENTATSESNSDYSVKEMPSITNLLRRKKLKVTRQSTQISNPPELPGKYHPKEQTETAEELSLKLDTRAEDGEDTTASQTATIPLQYPLEAAEAGSAPAPTDGINLSLDASEFQLDKGRDKAPAEHRASDAPAPIKVKVQPAAKRGPRGPRTKLAIWTPELLKSGSDPLGHGLVTLVQKGATAALFLAILPAPAGSNLPEFAATAAMNGEGKSSIWQGLKWDPKIVPELWNSFVQHGFVELSPPGTVTYKKSSRNVIRGAFGVAQDEWLLLVRTGPLKSCRGVLAIISKKSLLNDLPSALPQLTAPPSSSKAA